MGMRDESWCSSCGTSLPYSEDEVQCGECVTERADMIDSSFIEYMKIHLISLEQDSAKIQSEMNLIDDWGSKAYNDLEIEDISLNGQMIATAHLLSVANDILLKTKGN